MVPFSDIRDIADLPGGEFESVCKEHAANAYMGNNTVLCKILSKYKIYVHTQDQGIVPHLIMDGYWETWVTQCLARIVKPGDVCIDIGANFGYFTLLLSELCGTKGKTIAVEPNPQICDYLRMSQSIHPYHFEIMEAALSNKTGRTTLTIPAIYPGNASITSLLASYTKKQSKVKVKTLTLDELTEQYGLQRIDVIKMDIEGAEPMVFEGMKQTIARNPNLQIIMEYTPYSYPDAPAFTKFLFDHFTINRIKDVDQMTLLDESSIEDLIQLTDHTDLYLQRKEA